MACDYVWLELMVEKIMKKITSIIMAICIVVMCSACNGSSEQQNELSDYKPMIYIKNNLYGDTGNIHNSISDAASLIGTIEKLVPQDEEMSKEEFSSNVMPVGSEIYFDEENPEFVYIKFLQEGKEMYAEYAIIQ